MGERLNAGLGKDDIISAITESFGGAKKEAKDTLVFKAKSQGVSELTQELRDLATELQKVKELNQVQKGAVKLFGGQEKQINNLKKAWNEYTTAVKNGLIDDQGNITVAKKSNPSEYREANRIRAGLVSAASAAEVTFGKDFINIISSIESSKGRESFSGVASEIKSELEKLLSTDSFKNYSLSPDKIKPTFDFLQGVEKQAQKVGMTLEQALDFGRNNIEGFNVSQFFNADEITEVASLIVSQYKRTGKAAEESAEESEESMEREQIALENLNEIRLRAQKEKKKVYSFQDDEDFNDIMYRQEDSRNDKFSDRWVRINGSELEDYENTLNKLKRLQDEELSIARDYQNKYAEAYNNGNDNAAQGYKAKMQESIDYYNKYSDAIEYVNSQITSTALNFKPGDEWGTEEISALIILIQNLVSSINDISVAFNNLNTNGFSSQINDMATEISHVVFVIQDLKDAIQSINFNVNINSSGGKNITGRAQQESAASIEAIRRYKIAYDELMDLLMGQGNSLSVFQGQGKLFARFQDASDLLSQDSRSSQLAGYKQLIDILKEAASIKGIDLSEWSNQFEKVAIDSDEAFQKIISGEKEVGETSQSLINILRQNNNIDISDISTQINNLKESFLELKGIFKQGLGVTDDAQSSYLQNLVDSMNKLSTASSQVVESLNKIVEANQKVSDSAKETADSTEKAGDGIKKEGDDAATKPIDIHSNPVTDNIRGEIESVLAEPFDIKVKPAEKSDSSVEEPASFTTDDQTKKTEEAARKRAELMKKASEAYQKTFADIKPAEVDGSLDKMSASLAEAYKNTQKLADAKREMNNIPATGDGIEDINKASDAITGEGQAAEKAKKFKDEFTEANRKAAQSGHETAEGAEKATSGIEGEGEAAEKAKKFKEAFAEANKKVADSAEKTAEETGQASDGIKKEGDASSDYDYDEMKRRAGLIKDEINRIRGSVGEDERVVGLQRMYDSHDILVQSVLTTVKQVETEDGEILEELKHFNIHWDKKGDELYSSRMTRDDYEKYFGASDQDALEEALKQSNEYNQREREYQQERARLIKEGERQEKEIMQSRARTEAIYSKMFDEAESQEHNSIDKIEEQRARSQQRSEQRDRKMQEAQNKAINKSQEEQWKDKQKQEFSDKLLEAKKTTRVSQLSTLEAQLQSSGKMTDELQARFSNLLSTLSNVGDNQALQLFDEQIKQLKEDIKILGDNFETAWNKRLSAINNKQKSELDTEWKNNMEDILNRGKTTRGVFDGSHDKKGNWTGALAQETSIEGQTMTRYDAIIQKQKEMLSVQEQLNQVLASSFKSENPEAYAQEISQLQTKLMELYGEIRELSKNDFIENLTSKEAKPILDLENQISKAKRKESEIYGAEYSRGVRKDLEEYQSAISQYQKLYQKQLSGNLSADEYKQMEQSLETINRLEENWNKGKANGVKLSQNQQKVLEVINKAAEKRATESDYTKNMIEQNAANAEAVKAYNKLQNKISRMSNQSDWRASGWDDEVQRLQGIMNTLNPEDILNENALTSFLTKLREIEADVQRVQKSSEWQPVAKDWQAKAGADLAKWMNQNKDAAKAFREELEVLKEDIDSVGSKGESEDWISRFQDIQRQAADRDLLGKSLGDRFKDQFRNTMTSLATYYLSFQDFVRYGREAVEMVLEMDTAMTNLKKVSDESQQSFDKFQKASFDIAKSTGSTATAVVDAATEWARLGYSLEDAAKLSEASVIYSNVGEIDATTASKDLVSALKAFNMEADQSMQVVDVLNEIGNNYAVSSGELGTILEKASSSLALSGDSMEQIVAMGAGMNAIIQDASVVGSTLKVVGLRLRGAKTELTNMDEDTEGMVDSTPKLRAKIMGLTNTDGTGGFDIMQDEDTFKSTYDIIDGIAERWEDMSQIDQAALLELAAGKNRAQGLSALITQWDEVEEAFVDAQNASGSATEENEKYMDSLQGHINLFKNELQRLTTTTIDSDWLKDIIDLGSSALGIITSLSEAFGGLNVAIGAVAGIFLQRTGHGKIVAQNAYYVIHDNNAIMLSAYDKFLFLYKPNIGETSVNIQNNPEPPLREAAERLTRCGDYRRNCNCRNIQSK